ncbi:cold shock domain-containing protein CspD [Pasteurellaceae bacterium HPA106]|uniref:cold shock domain-containing protein CspD n=1 Tax=Spirabiliibacterium pneumoniae TaxID=221400 RepID=UPI001AACA375|nr:cold shock domain-containing protein CspD [Spirabiliibacterium pneumoniae]MBE2896181.1 cold shock domain-containing protein CspD [Spirabiliibacterium pneumoniae]
MPIGTVKWFNNAKGFGFIAEEGHDEDIFVHYSVIEMEGYRSLKAGQKVEFEAIHGDKGSHATKIVPIQE